MFAALLTPCCLLTPPPPWASSSSSFSSFVLDFPFAPHSAFLASSRPLRPFVKLLSFALTFRAPHSRFHFSLFFLRVLRASVVKSHSFWRHHLQLAQIGRPHV